MVISDTLLYGSGICNWTINTLFTVYPPAHTDTSIMQTGLSTIIYGQSLPLLKDTSVTWACPVGYLCPVGVHFKNV